MNERGRGGGGRDSEGQLCSVYEREVGLFCLLACGFTRFKRCKHYFTDILRDIHAWQVCVRHLHLLHGKALIVLSHNAVLV